MQFRLPPREAVWLTRCAPVAFMTTGILVTALALAAFAQAEPVGRPATGSRPAFEQFVPPKAQIFIAVSDFRELQILLQGTRPERLLPWLTGPSAQPAAIDPKTILQTFLGPECRLSPEDLGNARFAFAAGSWSQLAEGVLFVEMPDSAAFDRWFPASGSLATRISPHARILRLEHTTVCTRGNILAAGRSGNADALMRETIRLMAGRVSAALHVQEEFQRLLPYLPARPLAIAYFCEPETDGDAGESDLAAPADVQPGDLKESLAGVYAREGKLELAVRSNRKSGRATVALQSSTIKRLSQLPQSTLLAWATGIDSLGLQSNSSTSAGTLSRYLRTVRALSAPTGEDEPFPSPGQDLIVAWDQDARPGQSTPQVAILLQCESPRDWNDRFGTVVQGLLDRLYAFDPVGAEYAPSVGLTTYRDVAIASIDFSAFAAKSKFPAAKLLRNLQPSWAASQEGWAFTLTRQHLERLLDAEAAALPTLAAHEDFAAAFQYSPMRNSILLMQPMPASQTLGRWMADALAGRRSLLNPATWSSELVLRVMQPDRLGIGMHAQQEPGAVLVARVYPNTAAEGLLEPGDRIVGIDGRLLDLDSPNMDLRTRWHNARSTQQRTMRVWRDDQLFDVVLEFEAEPLAVPAMPQNVMAGLAEFVRIGSQVSSLVFAEHATDSEHFAALLSVRLTPPNAPPDASASTTATSANQAN